jgi:choline dehydrogenase
MPLVDLGYLTHPFVLLAVEEGIRMAKQWYEGPAYEGYITGSLGPDPDALPEEEFNNELKR